MLLLKKDDCLEGQASFEQVQNEPAPSTCAVFITACNNIDKQTKAEHRALTAKQGFV